jgi:hypothetical protein
MLDLLNFMDEVILQKTKNMQIIIKILMQVVSHIKKIQIVLELMQYISILKNLLIQEILKQGKSLKQNIWETMVCEHHYLKDDYLIGWIEMIFLNLLKRNILNMMV